MRVLITGSSGFIGRNLSKYLLEKKFTVLKIDKVQNSEDTICADIQNSNVVELIANLEPDIVIHLAALIDVQKSFENPSDDFLTNCLGTLNVLKGAINGGVANFVYITSGGAIYDASQKLPIPEDGKVNPLSPYGISKLAGEFYVKALCNQAKVNWSSLALSNCYGPLSENKNGVIPQWWNSLSKKDLVRIYGADTTRDFIYITDVVRAIYMVLETPVNQRLNISTGVETSLGELFANLTKIMKLNSIPEVYPLPSGEITRSALENKRAKVLLGWEPEITLKQGLEMILNEKSVL